MSRTVTAYRTRLVRDWHFEGLHFRLVHRRFDGYKVAVYIPKDAQEVFGAWFDHLRRFPSGWMQECEYGPISIGKTVIYGWSFICDLQVEDRQGDGIADDMADRFAEWVAPHVTEIIGEVRDA